MKSFLTTQTGSECFFKKPISISIRINSNAQQRPTSPNIYQYVTKSKLFKRRKSKLKLLTLWNPLARLETRNPTPFKVCLKSHEIQQNYTFNQRNDMTISEPSYLQLCENNLAYKITPTQNEYSTALL